MRIPLHLRIPALVAISALALAGCNSSSSDDGGSSIVPPQQTGTVGILITDAPTDEFDQILITVEEMRLLGANGNDDYLMFEGSETFDLLALTEFTDLFAVSDDVPVGEYEKIRLQVSGIELVELDDNGEVVRTEDVRPRGNGKLDLNPRGSFNVEADETLLVRLDIDARKSILLVGAGASGQYILRPVVFVDIDRGELRDRLVRLYGEVDAVDAEAITLCNLRRIQSDTDGRAYDGCVQVRLDDETGLFDPDGDPLVISGLTGGELATAIGFFAPAENGTQPFDALVVQVGERGPNYPFKLSGTATSTVDANQRFNLLAPGQGLDTADVAVRLQQGTALITRDGERVPDTEIIPDRGVTTEGVLSLNNAELKASLVLLDIGGDDVAEATLRGTVQTVDPLVVSTDDPPADVCVVLTDDVDVFEVSETEDGGTTTARVDADALESGQVIDAWGRERSDGCFEATSVIINLDGVDDPENDD